MSKILTVMWGAICTATAFATPYIGKNVVIAVNKMGSLTYGPIFATFALAILTKRANSRGVFAGIVAGMVDQPPRLDVHRLVLALVERHRLRRNGSSWAIS